MLSKEKIRIRVNLLIRSFLFHLVFWYAAMLLYAFLTGNDKSFSNYIEIIHFNSFYITNLFVSASLALLFTMMDGLINDKILRFSTLHFLVFLPSVVYILLGFALLTLAPLSPKELLKVRNINDLYALLPAFDMQFYRFMVYFSLACLFNNLFQRTVKKVGKGNFKNWLFGMMYKPKEAERIFMFVDMKSSTRIAEQLSHKKFSHLVQDIFNDMAIVDNYHGEIYQYLGDGAIISWSLKKGLKNNNFLRAFYSFCRVVERRTRYYERKYGVVPKFKAGVHVGKVMVLQVGRVRRDISYNGDTLNTTARIESMCNEYNKNLLVSGDLIEMMQNKEGFYVREVGNLRLKGKRQKVDVFHVRQKKKSAKQIPQLGTALNKLNVYKEQVSWSE